MIPVLHRRRFPMTLLKFPLPWAVLIPVTRLVNAAVVPALVTTMPFLLARVEVELFPVVGVPPDPRTATFVVLLIMLPSSAERVDLVLVMKWSLPCSRLQKLGPMTI